MNLDLLRPNQSKTFICQMVQLFHSLMTLGLFIAGFGAMFRTEYAWGLPVLILVYFGLSSQWHFVHVKDDSGFYVKKEEILRI